MAHHLPVTLSSLPLELRQAILSQVESPAALEAAVTAGKCLKEALQASGGSVIIARVLQRVIPQPLIPEAVAHIRATQVQQRDNDTLMEFLDEYFDSLQGGRPNHCWTLAEAVTVNAFHALVQQFTNELAAHALSQHPTSDDAVPPSDIVPPDEGELQRIQRAFYRFELYCNLFHRGPKKRTSRQHELGQASLFLSRFSPWENEQLACVYDFLYSQVAEPFNDVAAHDVEWGEIGIEHLGSTRIDGDAWRDHYLAKGLAFINQLRAATTYSERCQILKPNLGVCSYFLPDGLVWLNSLKDSSMIDEYEMSLQDYDDEQRNRLIPLPAVPDSDPGPEKVWNHVHQRLGCGEFIISERLTDLRERGYVFWDEWRLGNWGILRSPWVIRSLGRLIPSDEEYAKMRASLDRRSDIYLNGGRGWWSADDESHIVYYSREELSRRDR